MAGSGWVMYDEESVVEFLKVFRVILLAKLMELLRSYDECECSISKYFPSGPITCELQLCECFMLLLMVLLLLLLLLLFVELLMQLLKFVTLELLIVLAAPLKFLGNLASCFARTFLK